MDQYSGTVLHLQNLEVCNFTKREENKLTVETIQGRLNAEAKTCRRCGVRMHELGTRSIRLKHMSTISGRIDVEVEYHRYRCPVCGRIRRSHIPFKAKGHNITLQMESMIISSLDRLKMTVKDTAKAFNVSRNIVKELDRRRLGIKAGDMRPRHYSTYIGIDEFLLHHNHRCATSVVDLETGEVLFLERGNTIQQAEHFISFAGRDFMSHVKAVSMDMNAQFPTAFANMAPHVKIVYDPFHIIKSYNDRVITEIRRDEQRKLDEGIEKARREHDLETARELALEAQTLKRSNCLVLSSRKTLLARDEAAREHNRMLHEKHGRRGLSIPANEHAWSVNSSRRPNEMLASNERIQAAYVFREMLQSALACMNAAIMRAALTRYIAAIRKSRIKELEGIASMLEKRIDGIVSHAIYHISNGIVEGTNNMIKTLRRQAYGFRDDECFFLKIWDESRKGLDDRMYNRLHRKRA